jgi:hypothetical protein
MRGIIEDGNVTAIELAGKEIPLRKPFPVEEYKKIEQAAKIFIEYVDIEKFIGGSHDSNENYGAFDDQTIVDYLKENTEIQDAFFKILARNNDKFINMKKLLAELRRETGRNDLISQSISGMAAGLTKKAKNWHGNEGIYEQQWSDIEGMNSYRILPKYLDAVKKYYKL